MRIIKHGNLYELGELTCDKCGCKFVYGKEDLKLKHFHSIGIDEVEHWDEYIVNCPECENMLQVWQRIY